MSKRYTNLSSDIISLLTGLDNVDSIFTDFVASLDAHIRSGRTGTALLFTGDFGGEVLTGATIVDVRRKAIQVALCIACGAFQTGLLSYFTHRDLFPALMKVCRVF